MQYERFLPNLIKILTFSCSNGKIFSLRSKNNILFGASSAALRHLPPQEKADEQVRTYLFVKFLLFFRCMFLENTVQ